MDYSDVPTDPARINDASYSIRFFKINEADKSFLVEYYRVPEEFDAFNENMTLYGNPIDVF